MRFLYIALSAILLSTACEFSTPYTTKGKLSFDFSKAIADKTLSDDTYVLSFELYSGGSVAYSETTDLTISAGLADPLTFSDIPEGDFQIKLVLSKGDFEYMHIVSDATIVPGENTVDLYETDFQGGWLDEIRTVPSENGSVNYYAYIYLNTPYEDAFISASSFPALSYSYSFNGGSFIPASASYNSGYYTLFASPYGSYTYNLDLDSSAGPIIQAAGGPSQTKSYTLHFTSAP